jgi:hypothetical protein
LRKGRTTIFEPLSSKIKVERPELIKRIKEFLQPEINLGDEPRNYFLIVGESGTGKSTAIRDAVE